MNRLATHLSRAILGHLQVEKYINGINTAEFNVVASDRWVPEQLEIKGRLEIKPDLLRPRACVDKPACVEIASGGSIARVVIQVPPWVQEELVQCLCPSLSSHNQRQATPRSRAPVGGTTSTQPQTVSETECGRAVSPGAEKEDTAALEKVVVQVHGLELQLRTFTADECTAFREETNHEALQLLLRMCGKQQRAEEHIETDSAPAAANADTSVQMQPNSTAPDDMAIQSHTSQVTEERDWNSLVTKIHSNLSIQFCGVCVWLHSGQDASACLEAETLEINAMFRSASLCMDELWFGSNRLLSAALQSTLACHASKAKVVCQKEFPKKKPDQDQDSVQAGVSLYVPSLEFIASSPLPKATEKTVPAMNFMGPELEVAKQGEVAIRFLGSEGAVFTLPKGVGGLQPLFSVVNKILAAVAACDPCTAASLPLEKENTSRRTNSKTLTFELEQQEDGLDLEVPNRTTTGIICGHCKQLRCTATMCSEGGPCWQQETTAKSMSRDIPQLLRSQTHLAVKAVQLRLCGTAVNRTRGKDDMAQVQKALCHAFDELWPATPIQVAIEVRGITAIQVGRTPNHIDSLFSKAGGSNGRGVRYRAGRSRLDISAVEQVMELRLGGFGLYVEQIGAPYNWFKHTKIIMESLELESPSSQHVLLSCKHDSPLQVNDESAVGYFRQLSKSPPLIFEVITGCFMPRGLAGEQPWPVSSAHSSAPTPNTARSLSRPSQEGGLSGFIVPLVFDSSQILDETCRLNKWFNLPKQPPRMLFLNLNLSPIVVKLWPCDIVNIMEVQPEFAQSGLGLEEVFQHVNCGDLSAISVHSTLQRTSVELNTEDNSGSVSATVGSISASIDPRDDRTRSDWTLSLAVASAHAECMTSQDEVRPVFRMDDAIDCNIESRIQTQEPDEGDCFLNSAKQVRTTNLAVSCHKCIRIEVSPQLCNVASAFTTQVQAIAAAVSCGRPLPPVPAETGHPAQEITQEPEPEMQHTVTGSVSFSSVMISLCDAISPVMRIRLVLDAKSEFITHQEFEQDSLNVELQVQGLMGEFENLREGVWEPFLEPWGISVGVCGTPDMQMEIVAENPLLLNITAQFIRCAMVFSNQIQDVLVSTSTSSSHESKLPICLKDLLQGQRHEEATKDVANQPRIAAVNLTGIECSLWVFRELSLAQARQEAIAELWELSDESRLPGPRLVLNAKGVPTSLDKTVTMPACTALALKFRGIHAHESEHESTTSSTPSRMMRRQTTTTPKSSKGKASLFKRAASFEVRTARMAEQDSSRERSESPDMVTPRRTISRDSGNTASCGPLEFDINASQPCLTGVQNDRDNNLDLFEDNFGMFAGKNDNTWTRKENLPILPLKAGWCVPLVASSEKQARFRRRQAMASATGLRNAMMGPEFVAEVLAPQPSHRLLMIAPPLRIFNYTDQVLGLVFEIKLPGGTFEKIITRNSDARMMPAHLLGAQQPIDVQPLGLPPSPLLETSGSMEGSQFTDDAGTRDWHLPPNSIACVPIPKQICSGTTDRLGFRILANPSEDNFSASMVMPSTTTGNSTWSENVDIAQLQYDWSILRYIDKFFRIAAITKQNEEPAHVDIISVAIAPAFTVVNVTPSRLAVHVRQDNDSKAKAQCGLCHRRSSSASSLALGAKDDESEVHHLEPGNVVHLYHVNSTEPLMMQVRFEDPENDVLSEWSPVINDVLALQVDTPAKVEIPFSSHTRSASVEVSCKAFVASISCPFWLMNHCSLTVHACKGNPYPVLRGITVLDGVKDIKLCLAPKSNQGYLSKAHAILKRNWHLGGPQGQQPPSASSSTVHTPRSTGDDLKDIVVDDPRDNSLAPSSNSNSTSPAASTFWSSKHTNEFPVPVHVQAVQGQIRDEEHTYDFTVIRDPLPAFFGQVPAPTTCFHIVPSVMVSNCMQNYGILVRQPGKTASGNTMFIEAGKSKACWATSTASNRHIQIQPCGDNCEAECSEGSWSAEIFCDGRITGRHALTNKNWVRNGGDNDAGSLVLSVDIADAYEGIISISIYKEPCLVLGCWAPSISSVTVFTDGLDAESPAPTQRNTCRQASLSDQVMIGATNALGGVMEKTKNAVVQIRTVMQPVSVKERPSKDSMGGLCDDDETMRTAFGGAKSWGWPVEIAWQRSLKAEEPVMEIIVQWVTSSSSGPRSCQRAMVADGLLLNSSGTPKPRWRPPGIFQKKTKSMTFTPEAPVNAPSNTVTVQLSLRRVTPLVLLRVRAGGNGEQVSVMVRIRQRASINAPKILTDLLSGGHCDENLSATLRDTLEARTLAWAELSHHQPDLIELTDITLDQLGAPGGLEVEWACGYCGQTMGQSADGLPLNHCSRCASWILASANEFGGQAAGSQALPNLHAGSKLAISVKLSRIDVSVVCSLLEDGCVPEELLFCQLEAMEFEGTREHGHETGRLRIRSFRVDCQSRVAENRRSASTSWRCCTQMHRCVGVNTDAPQRLLETPAIFASVLKDGSSEDFLSVKWERPVVDAGANSICMKTLIISLNQRWELTIDTWAAAVLLAVQKQFGAALGSDVGVTNSTEATSLFGTLLQAARSEIEKVFEPPRSMPVFQAEKVVISRVEVVLWAALDLSSLPSDLVPEYLGFLVKFLCLSDTVSVEGTSKVFDGWEEANIWRSFAQVLALIRVKYEISMLLFLAKSIGKSNVLLLPRLPFTLTLNIGHHMFEHTADLFTMVDLSKMTCDNEYIQARRLKKEAGNVASLEEGFQEAGEYFINGLVGMTDLIVQPGKHLKKSGIGGLPEGVLRGILSSLVKPIDGLLQAFAAIFRGIAACFKGRFRNPRRKDSGDSPSSGSPQSLDPLDQNWGPNLDVPNPLRHKDPSLRGKDPLRQPRLLFGNSAVLREYTDWHAELLAKLGPALKQEGGLWNAWRLAGDGLDVNHYILCANYNSLLLVDLNRGQKPRRSRAARTIRITEQPSSSLDSWFFKSVTKKSKYVTHLPVRMGSNSNLLAIKDIRLRNALGKAMKKNQTARNVLASRAKHFKNSFRFRHCCCCRKRDPEAESQAEEQAARRKIACQWPWEDLKRVSFQASSMSTVCGSILRTSTGDMIGHSLWEMQVYLETGECEYINLGLSVVEEDIQETMRTVNNALRVLKAA